MPPGGIRPKTMTKLTWQNYLEKQRIIETLLFIIQENLSSPKEIVNTSANP